ncbi:MAG: alginate lyase family protein [Cyanobacteria bacterium P01_F01_bin.56]
MKPNSLRFSNFFLLIKTLPKIGIRYLLLNVFYRIKIKIGWFKIILPSRSCWVINPSLKIYSPFHNPKKFLLAKLFPDETSGVLEAGQKILQGEVLYFSDRWLKHEEKWHVHPISKKRVEPLHWSEIVDFEAERGDVKWIWEASRFDWVYQLGRAWTYSNDETFADKFWLLFESWCTHNPPNTGINWKCGQECSFRLFALIWAVSIFADSKTSSTSRILQLANIVYELSNRIEGGMQYALSQKNNHGLSEAVALYLAGNCLQGCSDAKRWKAKGKKLFIRQILEQFDEDGSYIQNSFNYTRLALRDSLIFLICCNYFGDYVPPKIKDRLNSAINLLFNSQDLNTGFLPNYGANDGANIFSLSGSNYLDYRPIIQSLSYLLNQSLAYSLGKHDEELIWLFGEKAISAKRLQLEPVSLAASNGGYYILRSLQSFVMVRCHTHRERPGHADMLHVDMWLKGYNIFSDGGTFSYYDKHHIGDFLKSTHAHNTVTVNNQSQMKKLSKFLWADWTTSRLIDFKISGKYINFSGEHFSYRDHGVIHQRSIYSYRDEWIFVDDIIVRHSHSNDIDLRWHLGGGIQWLKNDKRFYSPELDIYISTFCSVKLNCIFLEGGTYYPETCQSFFYGEFHPVNVLKMSCHANRSIRFLTGITNRPLKEKANSVHWNSIDFSLVHLPSRNEL